MTNQKSEEKILGKKDKDLVRNIFKGNIKLNKAVKLSLIETTFLYIIF